MRPYLNAMKRYVDFQGRSNRSQYWYFILTLVGFFFVAELLGAPRQLLAIINVIHILPNLAVTVRRLHDTDRSGWWILTGPIALIFLVGRSTEGANRFGAAATIAAPVASAVESVAPPMSPVDIIHQLERLASLKASGAIDDSEFQRMKAGITGQQQS